MLFLQCIICGTDNGRGDGFNDFPYRNKFAIYMRILEGNEKPEARLGRRVFSPLSGAHVNGLLMSPYILYRFAFKFSYCEYCAACTFLIALIIVRLDTPSVEPDVENCIQLLHSRNDFFLANDLLIYLYCSGNLSKAVFGYF